MDDLNSMLSSVLSDPEKMRQVQEMAASLGFGDLGGAQAQPEPPPPPPPQEPPQQSQDLSALAGILANALGQNGGGPPQQAPQQRAQSQMPDLSALAGMLGQNGGGQGASGGQMPDLSALAGMLGQSGGGQGASGGQMPDLSALAGMLGNAQGQAAPPSQQSQGFDVSALTNMLGGPQQGEGPAPVIDMNTMMKIGQAMSSMQSNRQNIDFLMALKPRLSDRRAKKVDDAVKVMQLVQFLPLLKESGLFQGLDSLLGGLTGGSGNSGGLGQLLGNMGTGSGGLGGLLSGLLGR